MIKFIVLCVWTLTLWIEFIFLLWILIGSFVWIGIVHGILFDLSGWYHCIWCYPTPVRWSRVTLTCTARIRWCCLFSYFVSKLRRDGLWACPQLSSYSWWGCEYNIYCWWQNYLQLLGEVDVFELYYWPARVFSRASWRCSGFTLSLGSLTWLTYAYGMRCQDEVASWRVFTPPMCMLVFLNWALKLMYV